jgi:CheY-like chemotaxis protein
MSSHEGTFHLPFISHLMKEKPATEKASDRRQRVATRERAICLDDDPLSLRLVEHLLKDRYDVISCANIDAAVRAVKSSHVDLFLCDYHLGEQFTGARAFEILTNKYGFNPIHRILITSYPSDAIEKESLEIGFSKVFAKPLRKEFKSYCLNLWMPPVSRPVAVI